MEVLFSVLLLSVFNWNPSMRNFLVEFLFKVALVNSSELLLGKRIILSIYWIGVSSVKGYTPQVKLSIILSFNGKFPSFFDWLNTVKYFQSMEDCETKHSSTYLLNLQIAILFIGSSCDALFWDVFVVQLHRFFYLLGSSTVSPFWSLHNWIHH